MRESLGENYDHIASNCDACTLWVSVLRLMKAQTQLNFPLLGCFSMYSFINFMLLPIVPIIKLHIPLQ